MDRIKLALNLRKPGNYAFFCPVSRLHLTRSNPVGSADGVTSAILVGLRSKVLLDVDGVVNLETGKIKKAADNNKEEIKTEQPVNVSEAKKVENVQDVKKEEETPKKKGKKPISK